MTVNQKALRKSIYASIGRLVGVILAGGAGSMLRQLVGDSLNHWGTAIAMVIVGFIAIFVAEYEREIQQ